MFVFTRRSTLPLFTWRPAPHPPPADRLTLLARFDHASDRGHHRILIGGGYGFSRTRPATPRPRALSGPADRPPSVAPPLAGEGWTLAPSAGSAPMLAALLLFLAWFLFFVPSGPTGCRPSTRWTRRSTPGPPHREPLCHSTTVLLSWTIRWNAYGKRPPRRRRSDETAARMNKKIRCTASISTGRHRARRAARFPDAGAAVGRRWP